MPDSSPRLSVLAALKTGGLLVISDYLPNEKRTAPAFALRFSVYALTHTPGGECYVLSEYSRWLQEAGFRSVRAHGDLPGTLPGTTLIVAEK